MKIEQLMQCLLYKVLCSPQIVIFEGVSVIYKVN